MRPKPSSVLNHFQMELPQLVTSPIQRSPKSLKLDSPQPQLRKVFLEASNRQGRAIAELDSVDHRLRGGLLPQSLLDRPLKIVAHTLMMSPWYPIMT